MGSTWLIGTFLAASVGYLALAGFVWANHRGVASRPLVVMLIALKIWTLCYAIELSSHDVVTAQVWSALKFIGIVMLPPGLWAYVYEYTGRGPLPRRILALMSIEPVIVLAILAFPPTSSLIHKYGPDETTWLLGAPTPAPGLLFWPHAIYTYALMLGAVSLLLAKLARIAPTYRRQGAILMAASLLPFVTNLIWNARFGDDSFDPTPLVFGITAVTMVWGFFRLKLLDVTPVARGIVIEQMNDGVLVLDAYGRVADANAAAARLVGLEPTAMIGREASSFLPALRPILEAPTPLGDRPLNTEVTLGPGDLPPLDPVTLASLGTRAIRDVAVSLTPVTDQAGHEVARSLVLRDVTDRNRTERQLRQLLEEQTRLSETLRQTLRPAQLPEIDRLRLAARSVPSARGGGVGGDFYDVHPAGRGRSAFVLGDVSGKGVHAAVVTSLARYTVRTLSAQGFSPRQVLEHLNRALIDQDDDERFCTVVYGHVLPTQPGQDGVRLVITLGGHPQPLVRRREGTVHAVGTPGTALGLLPGIDVTEVGVDLAAGDVLLAYTDGVTEARNGAEQFGEERLAEVLAGIEVDAIAERVAAAARSVPRPGEPAPLGNPPDGGIRAAGEAPEHGSRASRAGRAIGTALRGGRPAERPPGAGLLADAVADSVLSAVGSFSSERDDVAVLVLAAM